MSKVANIILNQLGGNRFLAMTGSHRLVAGENLLAMKLRRNNSGANYLRITLTSMDLYTMEFLSIRGNSIKTKVTKEGIYNDMLESVFTNVTGLNTTL